MKKGILALGLLVVALAASFYWNSLRHQKHLKYEDLSKTNPYETLARQTGGQVMHIDRNNMEESTKKMTAYALQSLEEDREYSFLWTSEGRASGKDTEIQFSVSPDTTLISVFVSGVTSRPQIKVFGPTENMLTPDEVLDSKQTQTLLFKTPHTGIWKSKITSSDNISIQIKAKTSTWIPDPVPVRLEGRPGHQGYFPYKGILKPGAKERFSVEWPAVLKIKNGWLSPVSLDGRILSRHRWDEDVLIPQENFRIRLDWEDQNGNKGQRMSVYPFTLNRPEMIEFRYKTEEQPHSEKCKLLEVSSFWSLLTDSKTNASAHVSCIAEVLDGKERWSSNLTMLVPWNPSEKVTTTKLLSADYQKLSAADCDRAQKLFSSYPKVTRELGQQVAILNFACQPDES